MRNRGSFFGSALMPILFFGAVALGFGDAEAQVLADTDPLCASASEQPLLLRIGRGTSVRGSDEFLEPSSIFRPDAALGVFYFTRPTGAPFCIIGTEIRRVNTVFMFYNHYRRLGEFGETDGLFSNSNNFVELARLAHDELPARCAEPTACSDRVYSRLLDRRVDILRVTMGTETESEYSYYYVVFFSNTFIGVSRLDVVDSIFVNVVDLEI